MIPFRLTQQQFRDRYLRCLEKSSKHAIEALRRHLMLKVEPGVDSADVKVFIEDDEPYAPSVWMYYAGKGNKVDNADQSLFAGRSLELAVGLDALDEFNPRFFTDEKFGGLTIATSVLQAWVAECWWKAGGWSYPLPVTLSVAEGGGDGQVVKLTEHCT